MLRRVGSHSQRHDFIRVGATAAAIYRQRAPRFAVRSKRGRAPRPHAPWAPSWRRRHRAAFAPPASPGERVREPPARRSAAARRGQRAAGVADAGTVGHCRAARDGQRAPARIAGVGAAFAACSAGLRRGVAAQVPVRDGARPLAPLVAAHTRALAEPRGILADRLHTHGGLGGRRRRRSSARTDRGHHRPARLSRAPRVERRHARGEARPDARIAAADPHALAPRWRRQHQHRVRTPPAAPPVRSQPKTC
jgi:hypothetical protein